MFTISEEIIEKANKTEISVSHGRIGEWNEYVEFSVPESKIRIVAQNSRGEYGDCWFVFRVRKGKNGDVASLYQSYDFNDAVRSAHYNCSLIGS